MWHGGMWDVKHCDAAFRSTVMFVLFSVKFKIFRFYILDAKTMQVTVELVEFHRSDSPCVCVCVCVCVLGASDLRGYLSGDHIMQSNEQMSSEECKEEKDSFMKCYIRYLART